MFCLTGILPSLIYGFFSTTPLLKDELVNTLPNVTTLSFRAQIALRQKLEKESRDMIIGKA